MKKNSPIDIRAMKTRLEDLYNLYNKKKYVDPDPLEFLYSYPDIRDREIVGLIASSLAYGKVKQILKSVSKALDIMHPSPALFLENISYEILYRTYKDFKHRFADGKSFTALLFGIKRVIQQFGSLNECFLSGISSSSDNSSENNKGKNLDLKNNNNIIKGIKFLATHIIGIEKNKPGHLIPLPQTKSACKRMNLFLRWMIRKDEVDPGGWKGVLPSELIIPLDTHMHKIALALNFTKRKQNDMKTAVEITSVFKTITPEDPVKYDFALTRFGIRDDMELKDLY